MLSSYKNIISNLKNLKFHRKQSTDNIDKHIFFNQLLNKQVIKENIKIIPLKISLFYLFFGVMWCLLYDKIEVSLEQSAIKQQVNTVAILIFFILFIITIIYISYSYYKKIKYAENILNETNRAYKLAICSSVDGLWCWDISTGEICFSESWSQLIGLSTEDTPNSYKGWEELVHPDDMDNVKKCQQGYLAGKSRIYKVTYRIRSSNGEYKWILTRGQVIRDEDRNPIYMAGSHTDITQQKELEKELMNTIEENKKLLNKLIESDILKTEFMANISHELRTPLNVIFSTLQLIDFYNKEGNDFWNTSKKNRYINIMKQNCYRQLRLINNLIDITRIDAGYFKIYLKNYDIIRIIENITLSVAEYIKNKNITFQFDTDIEEKVIACDADKIERIILNLLSNAVKFTPSGGNIWVNVSDLDEKIRISVKDNGIGIPKEKQAIIFERFRQVDNLFTRDCEGSGIGLSLVKSLVENHEGEIQVISEHGKGSEFIIEIPTRLVPEADEKVSLKVDKKNYVELINVEFSDVYLCDIA